MVLLDNGIIIRHIDKGITASDDKIIRLVISNDIGGTKMITFDRSLTFVELKKLAQDKFNLPKKFSELVFKSTGLRVEADDLVKLRNGDELFLVNSKKMFPSYFKMTESDSNKVATIQNNIVEISKAENSNKQNDQAFSDECPSESNGNDDSSSTVDESDDMSTGQASMESRGRRSEDNNSIDCVEDDNDGEGVVQVSPLDIFDDDEVRFCASSHFHNFALRGIRCYEYILA
jgi:hypothetical protein